MAFTTATTRTIAAECRFVEEGHRVRLDAERHVFRVVSDSRPGVTYEVTVAVQGAELRGSCTCPAGRHARHGVACCCKHVAGAFHTGEAHGWAAWDGQRWIITGALAKVVAAA